MVNSMLFLSLVFLNIADALLTRAGGAHEANPMILWLMTVAPDSWVVWKVIFTTFMGSVLYVFHAQRLLALGVMIYSALCVYHAVLIEAALQ